MKPFPQVLPWSFDLNTDFAISLHACPQAATRSLLAKPLANVNGQSLHRMPCPTMSLYVSQHWRVWSFGLDVIRAFDSIALLSE